MDGIGQNNIQRPATPSALIDLIAYVGQSIAFRVDLNARENFLELAERRESILRLARLISYNPKRNIPATGLLKFNTVSTTESVLDSNGRNLAGQYVTWNDPSNDNWYDQFIKIVNSALIPNQQFGNPVDQATIYGVPTSQYRFNATNTDVPIYGFSKTVAGRSMDFEITSTTFSGKTYIYEEAPKVGSSIACVYSDDGYGASSPNTGFFFHMTQGSLNQGVFTIAQPSSNEVIDIGAQNINNTDIWLYALDNNGLETNLWEQVPAVSGNNIIYNSLNKNIKDIYSVITKVNDAVTLSFSDGTFGNLPLGSFRVYYRVSNGLSYTINTSDIRNVTINIPYKSVQGQDEVLTISLGLATSISNATPAETNDVIKVNAPQTYYTQNRMITGEDYNISPLAANQQISKVKSVNRTSSGISRYFDLIDPTGKYSSTNLFSDDGVLYRQDSTTATTFTFTTRTDIQDILYNTVADIIASPNVRNFYYSNYVNIFTQFNNITWVTQTSDSTSCTGYVRAGTNPAAVAIGSAAGTTRPMIYMTPGALLKFEAPEGYSFNTKSNNKLVANTSNKAGYVQYIWAEIVAVSGTGATALLSTGYGPVTLSKVIPNASGIKITQVIPEFNTVISRATQTAIIDLIYANAPFGLRYDAETQTWQIIFESNLDMTSDFSLGNKGDSQNNRADSSWMLLFTTNNEYYTITARSLRYVFESDTDITFYFDNNVKIYDSTVGSVVTDEINILSINNRPGNDPVPFTQDMKWRIVSEYIGLDGYVDPKKIIVSFADADSNGIVDNPQSFLDIVVPTSGFDKNYIVQKRYVISEGQEDYKYVYNDTEAGPVIVKATDASVGSPTQYDSGAYFYIEDQSVVKKFNDIGQLVPTLDYKVYVGRSDLRFQYIHSADYDSRIDPGLSNIIDVYVLTSSYDTQFRQWLAGSNVTQPLPPSSDELQSMLASSLNPIKAMSDEIIYHPVKYKLLFGPGADESMQATFNVIMNPSSTASHADVTARILTAINQFFALANWDFGDTFYFTELSTYVMNQLAPDITNFVIVPKKSGQYFGSLFEIKCPSNEIFLSSATANEIVVVAGLTSANLKTVTGVALNTVTSQQITSANYGASN